MQDSTEIDIDKLLAERGQIAIIWSVEDVKEIHPDLDDEQAWEVLKIVLRRHDATLGVTWDTLECVAQSLFGFASASSDE
ncbi:hypothetical protein [Zavarzinella formosa]|uniref:hypothetical protein n=1 Tax=Zavarzinella formosa TaxID=360055 RepID=UPI000315B753|nr:hypothetical protein [Zavarzinella formosa]